MLREAWFIAWKDVAFMLQQKETILWTFVMPFLFFYFIGTVTAGFSVGPSDRPDTLALRAPLDGGAVVDELVRRLEEQNYKVVRPETDEEFESFTRRLTVPAPESGMSLTDAVAAGEKVTVTFRRRGEGMSASYDQVRLGRAVYTVLADLVVLAEEGDAPAAAAFERLARMPRALTLEVKPAGKRKVIPTGYEQTIPGTMIMFTMLVLLTSGSILLVIEREQGLLRRLASTPISRSSVVLGKWIGKMALALVQIAFAMLIGTVVFGMEWGAALPWIGLLLFAWAAFNASFGILLANLARSEGQMMGIGVLVSMVLAALGGCWWPIEITPDWLQSFALFLPTGWAMDAMHKLISFGYSGTTATPHIIGTFAAAVLLGWLGVRTFRYH